MTKNERVCIVASSWHMTANNSSADGKKLTKWPLPPNMAEVEQKLQPMGQPTEGIRAAAEERGSKPRSMPSARRLVLA